jgi:hypothetical protein
MYLLIMNICLDDSISLVHFLYLNAFNPFRKALIFILILFEPWASAVDYHFVMHDLYNLYWICLSFFIPYI